MGQRLAERTARPDRVGEWGIESAMKESIASIPTREAEMRDHGKRRIVRVPRARVARVKPPVARRRYNFSPAGIRNFETLLSKMNRSDAQRFRRLLKKNADLTQIICRLTSDNAGLRQVLSLD